MHKRFLSGLGVASLLVGCGQVKPSDDRTTADVEAAAKNEDASAEAVTLEITADYKIKPVDVLVVRENSDRLSQTTFPFRNRLYNNDGTTPRAYQNLAVRMFNAGADFQVGVVDAVHQDAVGTNSGLLIGDAEGNNRILTADSFEFIEQATTRFAHTVNRAQWQNYQPLLTIKNAVNLAGEDSVNKGFIRDKAFLAVLTVSYKDEKAETIDTGDIVELLNSKKGAGNWSVWNLGAPDKGCSFKDNNENTVYVNQDASAANIADAAADGALEQINSYDRRSKLLRLVEASGGQSFSICEESYVDFMTKFVEEGMKPGFFAVKLKKEPDPATIKVSVNKNPVEGWKYLTASQEIMLPTSIKKGTKIVISYNTPVSGPVVNGPKGEGEDIGKIGEAQLSEAELAWLTEVDGISPQQAYAANCAGCHGRYRDFDQTYAGKAQDLSVITEADKSTAGGGMPRNGDPAFDSSPAGQAIINWINNY